MRVAQVGDEECGLGIGGKAFETRHDPGPGEERRSGVVIGAGVPVEETVTRLAGAETVEEFGGGGDKSRVVGLALHGLANGGGDGLVDLLRQIEVMPGEWGEERVEKMEPAQLGGSRHFLCFGVAPSAPGARLLISWTNSETSRNSL